MYDYRVYFSSTFPYTFEDQAGKLHFVPLLRITSLEPSPRVKGQGSGFIVTNSMALTWEGIVTPLHLLNPSIHLLLLNN